MCTGLVENKEEDLDYHKSLSAYFKTKLNLFKNLSKNSISIINKSDKYGKQIKDATNSKIEWFSIKNLKFLRSIQNLLDLFSGIQVSF